MIFVRYNETGIEFEETSFVFCLDHLVTIDADGNNKIKIVLSNEDERTLLIDIDEFMAKVFSDENNAKEYNEVVFEARQEDVNTSKIPSA